MNSFLQALYHMQDFRNALLAFDDATFLLSEGTEAEPAKAPTLQQKIKLGLYQLQRLFAQLGSLSDRPTVAPRAFKALALPDFFRGPSGGGGE